MEQCSFKPGDIVTNKEWQSASYYGMDRFEISVVKGEEFWFKGYEDQQGRKESQGYYVVEKAKTNSPHKHVELIKAWADDPSLKFEVNSTLLDEWVDAMDPPSWHPHCEYRIKPTSKPDIVIEKHAFFTNKESPQVMTMTAGIGTEANVRFTVDGESLEIKSVELI